MSSVERELFFVKALREAPGTKVVGVFGLLHLVRVRCMRDTACARVMGLMPPLGGDPEHVG
jgi:hypothetical protein